MKGESTSSQPLFVKIDPVSRLKFEISVSPCIYVTLSISKAQLYLGQPLNPG